LDVEVSGSRENNTPTQFRSVRELPGTQIGGVKQDNSIEDFFENLDDDFLRRSFSYTNNQGTQYLGTAAVAVLHFFNHQRTIAAKSM